MGLGFRVDLAGGGTVQGGCLGNPITGVYVHAKLTP